MSSHAVPEFAEIENAPSDLLSAREMLRAAGAAKIHLDAPIPSLRPHRTTSSLDVFNPNGPLIITIDGPAGTGKSTVARLLARQLGLDFLDTGAMYRTAAAIALDHGIDPRDAGAIVRKVGEGDVRFDWTTDPPTILAFDKAYTARIREPDVNAVVSPIAGIRELRELMVRKQREIGLAHRRLVTEGRDQGSIVFPDATVKFYLDADARVRAERRADELRKKGHDALADEVLRDIVQRDRSDMSRADGPLICPHDAIRVDTSSLSVEQVVAELDRIVRVRARN